MKDKKLIIAIILGIGAVLSLVYGIRGSSGTKASGRSKQEKSESLQATPSAIPKKRLSKKTEHEGWGRNPFVPKGSAAKAGTNLVLDGIMWSDKSPKAMIGDAIVGVGQTIGPHKVTSITRNSVTVVTTGPDGEETTVLKLSE